MANPYAEYAPQAASNPYAQFVATPSLAWSDVPLEALKNTPKSAVNLAQNLAQPIIHPIDTATSIFDLTKGLASKAMRSSGLTDLLASAGQDVPSADAQREIEHQKSGFREQTADSIGQFLKERYGSGEGVKKTLATDPVGAVADLAGLLTGGAGLVGRGTMVGGALARASSVVDPLTNVGRIGSVFTRLAEPVASQGLGFSTGAGPDAIRTAARAGFEGNQAFPANMRGNVAATDMVDMAQRGLAAERGERGANYRAGMAPVNADTTVLATQPVLDGIDRATNIGNFRGTNPPAMGGSVFNTNRSAGNIQQQMADVVQEWHALPPAQFHTAAGFDALKKAIGDLRDSTQYGTPERTAADRVYHAVGDEIRAQVPEYAATMDAYGAASDQIRNIQGALSLGEKATSDTSIRKLQSVMRNTVQNNMGERQRLMEVLAQHEPDLPFAIAGQSLNSPTPRGLVARGGAFATVAAATHNPLIGAALLAESPRIVGEGAYLAGRGAGAVSGVADALGVNANSSRVAGQAAVQAGEMSKEMKKNKELARLLMQRNEQRAR